MKSLIRKLMTFVIVIVVSIFLTACAAGTAGLQQLPDEGRLLVLTLVTAAVTWVLLQLSAVFKIDLSGWANAIAAALAPIIVTVIESYLRLIPPLFDNIVITIIHLIVLLVGSLGTIWIVQRKPAPSLR